jgi:hypothetical protein
LPEAASLRCTIDRARHFIDRNDTHRGLSHFVCFAGRKCALDRV